MGKVLLRLTIIFTSFYFILSYVLAQFWHIDILDDCYGLLFELVCVTVCYSDGKYFCRFMRYTALALLLSDTLTRLDNAVNILSVTAHNMIPIVILVAGIATSTYKAIAHFSRVIQVTIQRNG